MSRVLNRAQLCAALVEAGVEFPLTATVTQLRVLHDQIGADIVDPPLPQDQNNQREQPPAEHPYDNEVMLEEEANVNAAGANGAADNDEIEVARLRRRREILQLQREIREMEIGLQPVAQHRRVDYSDIENALPPFTGDDSYNVRKYIADFEEVAGPLDCDDQFRLRSLRRLLSGTAKTFLRTIRAENYFALRDALIIEFDSQLTRPQIFAQLASRHIASHETSHQYVLNMQELASHIEIDDGELLDFIINGFHDPVGTVILYSARTVAELKLLLPRYEQRRQRLLSAATRMAANKMNTNKATAANKQSTHRSTNTATKLQQQPQQQLTRCYNCAAFGHFSAQCPQPKRVHGACFKCQQLGHTHVNCPKRVRANEDVVAAAHDEDAELAELFDALATNESVSVSFLFGVRESELINNVCALFDTGSPASFVRRSCLPDGVQCGELYLSRYRGLGSMKLSTYGKIKCNVKIHERKETIDVLILPDDVLPTTLLLGRDCLEIFGIKLMLPSLPNNNTPSTERQINFVVDSHFHAFDFTEFNCPLVSGDDVASATMLCGLQSIDEPFCSEIIPPSNAAAVTIVEELSCTHLKDICAISYIEPSYYIGPEISLALRDECESLIDRVYASCLTTAERSSAPPSVHVMQIRLTSDTPFHCPPRRLSVREKIVVQQMVDDLLKDGIIQHSDSPYASPIVLTKKKSGEDRMCIDYRGLNKLTIRDNYPLPLIEDCLEYLDGKQWFTVLDLKSGFHQVQMSPESVKYTAFVTPTGQYEYLKMPFGLKNAPSVFQRFITSIFRDFLNHSEIMIYLDDIILATADPVSHLALLERVLTRLRKYRLELKLSKCKFLYREIDYLGYTVDSKGIRPNDGHIQAIHDYPTPRNTKELQSCLGLFSYFRRFVPSFSRVAKPLLDLLKNDSVFKFNGECLSAFNQLRDALVSAPVLALYNPTRESELHTDASSHGFGAVLLQKQDDGRLHPVSYYSRRTTGAESRYHSFELETLAIIYSLRRFRVYLEGIPFRIVTDCNSLTMTLSKKTINPRIARWALELENYNYTIHHRSGVSMGHVDALSRCHVVAIVQSDDVDFQLQATQARDPVIVGLRESLELTEQERYELRDGLVYRRFAPDRVGLYVPAEMEWNVIRLIHEQIGHLGIDKCYDQIRRHYWFPNMRPKIEKFIRNCIQCIMYTAPVRINERNLHSIPKQPIPFDTIHIDHYGPLPSVQSKQKYILVVVDAFTKFVKLYPAKSTSTREVICSLQKYFDYYSRPRRIISDRGTCFTSFEFSEFLLNCNIEHVKVAVASPQANGQVERVNRVLTPMLGKSTESVQHADWSKILPRVEYALNNSVHCSTKRTPSELLFGVTQRGREVDSLTEHLDSKVATPQSLETIRESAAERITGSQARNERLFLTRSKPPRNYSTGDFVVMRNVDTSVGSNKKLIPKFRGPYVVHKVLPHDRYVIRDIENCQLTQLPYDGVVEAARLRLWKDERDKLVAACL